MRSQLYLSCTAALRVPVQESRAKGRISRDRDYEIRDIMRVLSACSSESLPRQRQVVGKRIRWAEQPRTNNLRMHTQ